MCCKLLRTCPCPRKSAMISVLLCEGPRIALYLEDKTPFSASYAATRCLTHFTRYQVYDNTWMLDECSACSDTINCDVQSHLHSMSSCNEASICYHGRNEDGNRTSYLWVPQYDVVLCETCTPSYGATDQAINVAIAKQRAAYGNDSHLLGFHRF